MWGQARFCISFNLFSRIIPTRVGTRASNEATQMFNEDHPHACGDKSHSPFLCRGLQGSSPRVWGQEDKDTENPNVRRIIPTRVGTSHTLHKITRQRRDHPHACGDKPFLLYSLSTPQGSSPRVWGQGERSDDQTISLRIIPTRVGTRKW